MTITLIHSKKAYLAVALLTAAVLSSIVMTYAEVTVGSAAPLQGTLKYSLDNAEAGTWNTTLAPNCPSDSWFSRLEINGAGYNGLVTVTWKLQQKTGFSDWSDVTGAAISTSMVLSGNVQNVYATSDGSYSSGNHDWGQDITTSGTYRVVVTVMAQELNVQVCR
jgi:hypothetical protein